MAAPRSRRNHKMVRGDQYVGNFQFSVDSILGPHMRRVISKGSAFFNRDRWTLIWFVVAMCAWASQNPGQKPSFSDVAAWCRQANDKRVDNPHICIAATPLRLTLQVALALVGGAYHEAWHTKYSRRHALNAREMYAIVMSVWDRIPDWSKLARTVNRWSNIVEDIRIERCGCEDFPGAKRKMHDLQEFILNQERDSRKKAISKIEQDIRLNLWAAEQQAKGLDPRYVVRTLTPEDLKAQLEAVQAPAGMPTIEAQVQAQVEEQLNSALPVISATFRDVGLGYNTERQRKALDEYRARNAEAVQFVLDGPLTDLLRQAIRLAADDDLGCLRIAMQVMVHVYEEAQNQDQQDQQDGDGGEGGEGAPQGCPNCGSPNVKVTPTTEGKGMLACDDCGFQQEIDLQDSKGSGQGGDSSDESQDSNESDGEGEGEGSDGEAGDDSDSKPGKGKSQDGDDSDDQDGKGAGSEGDEGDESGDDESEGAGNAGDDSEGNDSEGAGSKDGDDSDDSPEDSDGPGDNGDESKDGDEPEMGDDAAEGGESKGQGGGHFWDDSPVKPWDLAQAFLDDAAEDKTDGLKDATDALGESFEEAKDQEDNSCLPGEAPYRPFDRSLDTEAIVEPSTRGKADDGQRAMVLLDSVRKEAAFLRARLRVLVRSVQQSGVEHGLRKGKGLSERMFVDDLACLRAGRMPNRAYYEEDEEIDTSMASVVVMDESISMRTLLPVATQIFMALTEPMDALGAATAAIGFRDGQGGYKNRRRVVPSDDTRPYHRAHGVHIDVFKTFEERFGAIKWRFANTRAQGGTPMADGVQAGLEMLATRPETHRILFVVTDGYPNGGHAEVIQRQVRLAREAGIHVVGVLLGTDYGTNVFPDYVACADASEMPKRLVSKLNSLLDFRGLKRRRGSVRALRQTG